MLLNQELHYSCGFFSRSVSRLQQIKCIHNYIFISYLVAQNANHNDTHHHRLQSQNVNHTITHYTCSLLSDLLTSSAPKPTLFHCCYCYRFWLAPRLVGMEYHCRHHTMNKFSEMHTINTWWQFKWNHPAFVFRIITSFCGILANILLFPYLFIFFTLSHVAGLFCHLNLLWHFMPLSSS